MRIIGGAARSRRLISPSGTDTRPTLDKTRESLFNILLRDVPNSRVLDLFGGTGALALEAMSRGAQSAVICDSSTQAIKAIRTNIRTVMGDNDGVKLIKADYKAALKQLKGEIFDLVFLDPPYGLKEAYSYAVKFILSENMLSEDGIIILERLNNTVLALPQAAWVYDTRLYRDTAIDFISWETTA